MMVALILPAATVAVVGTLRMSAMIIHHGLLSLWTGRYRCTACAWLNHADALCP